MEESILEQSQRAKGRGFFKMFKSFKRPKVIALILLGLALLTFWFFFSKNKETEAVETIIKEWSLRWKSKVKGWWIDGCYFANEMYKHDNEPNFKSFCDALKAGNKNSIVAFNPGVKTPVISFTEFEDYTAGEICDAFPTSSSYNKIERWINGKQYHVLTFLGEGWGKGNKPRFSDEFSAGFTKDVNSCEGVVTWDVPFTKKGLIKKEFIHALKNLSSITKV
jgi:hypothetical protein